MSGLAVLLSFFVGYKYALKSVGAAEPDNNKAEAKTSKNEESEGMVSLKTNLDSLFLN